MVRFLSGRISFPTLRSREFNRFLLLLLFFCFLFLFLFFESTTTAAANYGCVIDVGFNVGIEDFFKYQYQQCTLV